MSHHLPALPSGVSVFERGWLSANNILLHGAAHSVLIDTGYLSHVPQTLQLVAQVLGNRPLHQIVNTHLHSDHCGGNAALQARYGCQTAIAAAEAAKVSTWDEERLSYRATGQQCARFGFDQLLQPGEVWRWGDLDWQLLAAPGHDPHALLLYAPEERLLISGDALWQNGMGVLFPELAGEDGFGPARATLALIASLDVQLVIPGHGAMFADVHDAVRRAEQRLDALQSSSERHAWHALRVLLKFLLLEKRRIAYDSLPALLASIPLFVSVNQRFLGQDVPTLAEEVLRQLQQAQAARLEAGWVCDA